MRAQGVDKVFLGIIIVLILSGFIILSSASMGLLSRSSGFYYKILFQQFLYGIVGGTILLLISLNIDYKFWKKFSLLIFIFGLLITALVFIPGIGVSRGGASRWIDLGPISFHPSEILKFGFIIYLSSWLSSRKKNIKSFKSGVIPFIIIMSLVAIVLIKQPDIGTLGVFAITGLIMFFIAGAETKHLLLLLIIGAIIFGILIWIEPYRLNRVKTFLYHDIDTKGISYQLKQSLIAIGSGGLFGRGFGMSLQKFTYLPEPISDSIFSVFAEEFGFIGCTFLLILFMSFLFKGISISMNSPDDFSKLLSAGIVIMITIESLINISSMIGLIPMTGVPLNFISKGGTALAITLLEMGVLLNISKYRNNA